MAFGTTLVKGLAAASRRAALALDEARPFGPVSSTRRCSGISSVRSFTTRTTSARLAVLGAALVLVGVARGGAVREDRGDELARDPQVLAHRLRPRSATPSSAAALAAPPPLKNGLARLSPATSPGRGAQIASTTGACGGAFARAVARPFSDRAARAPHDHGGAA